MYNSSPRQHIRVFLMQCVSLGLLPRWWPDTYCVHVCEGSFALRLPCHKTSDRGAQKWDCAVDMPEASCVGSRTALYLVKTGMWLLSFVLTTLDKKWGSYDKALHTLMSTPRTPPDCVYHWPEQQWLWCLLHSQHLEMFWCLHTLTAQRSRSLLVMFAHSHCSVLTFTLSEPCIQRCFNWEKSVGYHGVCVGCHGVFAGYHGYHGVCVLVTMTVWQL